MEIDKNNILIGSGTKLKSHRKSNNLNTEISSKLMKNSAR